MKEKSTAWAAEYGTVPVVLNFYCSVSLGRSLLTIRRDLTTCPINIDKYANTTNGTIPILAEDANNKNMLKDGDWVLMTSFGAGFAWGSVLMKWKKI